MGFHVRFILKILGMSFMISGACMILPGSIALYFHEAEAFRSFFAVMVPMVLLGFLVYKQAGKGKPEPALSMRDGILITSGVWLLVPLAGCLPYMLSGAIPDFFDAFFESVSSFTTTGASVLTDIESLPKSILFWRGFGNWLGGMGILVFAVSLLPALGINGMRILQAETPGPSFEKFTPLASGTAKTLYLIYIGLTLAEVLLLSFGGTGLYDAVIHSMGTMGTGGFSGYNLSIAAFDSLYIEVVITIFMFLAGTNFTLYYFLLHRNWNAFFKNTELRVFASLLIVVSLVIAFSLYLNQVYDSPLEAFRYGFFQTTSITTTTGFSTTDYDLWPTTCRLLLFLLLFTGACSGSTSGGPKLIRIIVIFKLIRRDFYKRLHPHSVLSVKTSGRKIPSDIVSGVISFLFLYILLFFLGTLAVTISGEDLIVSASASIACLGNVGPGIELVGPAGNYSSFAPFIKFLLSIFMIMGRLELFTVLLLVFPSFWKR